MHDIQFVSKQFYATTVHIIVLKTQRAMDIALWENGRKKFGNSKLTVEQRIFIGNQALIEGNSLAKVSLKWNVSIRTVRTCKTAVTDGKTHYLAKGKPPYLLEKDLEDIKDWLETEGNCVTTAEFEKTVTDAVHQNLLARGVEPDQFKKLSKKYFQYTKKKLGVSAFLKKKSRTEGDRLD